MYGNSNSDVVNISDYYSKSMTEDKTVNNIYIYGKHALLATAFGIVDVNMENCEISNTYNIGINVDYGSEQLTIQLRRQKIKPNYLI